MIPCECTSVHERRRVVLTGGPGAGKTALLEMIRQSFCSHVRILPEAASIVFGGGFPRESDPDCRRAAQRAIYHVQRELEAVGDSHNPAIVLCDRGTIDGLAYWDGSAEDFWAAVHTTRGAEFARYDAVLHLRTPGQADGYNHQNPLRVESANEAAAIDARIVEAWEGHPRRFIVESSTTFIDKVQRALDILRGELPECCKRHHVHVPTEKDTTSVRAAETVPRAEEPPSRKGVAMKTFTLVITTLAIAGTSILTPSMHAQSAATPAPSARTDSQDHQAHHPAEPAQPAKPADTKMRGMQNKMMADMKARDAQIDALVAKMNAATGSAKVEAIAELLTATVQQHKTMRDGMLQMQDGMMMEMHDQMMKMGGGK